MCIGIIGTPLKWFSNYLSNRIQVVKYKNYISKATTVNLDIVQDSQFELMLFNIFIKRREFKRE